MAVYLESMIDLAGELPELDNWARKQEGRSIIMKAHAWAWHEINGLRRSLSLHKVCVCVCSLCGCMCVCHGYTLLPFHVKTYMTLMLLFILAVHFCERSEERARGIKGKRSWHTVSSLRAFWMRRVHGVRSVALQWLEGGPLGLPKTLLTLCVCVLECVWLWLRGKSH